MHSHAIPSQGTPVTSPEGEQGIPAQRGGSVVIARADQAGEAREAFLYEGATQAPSALDRIAGALLLSDLLVVLALTVVAPWSRASSVALAGGIFAAFSVKSLYKSRLTLSVLDDLPVIFATVPAVVALVALSSTVPTASREVVIHLALALTLFVAGRAVTYAVIRWARSTGRGTYRTLIVGNGGTAALLARILDSEPSHGLRVVGFVGRRDEAPDEVRQRVVEEDARRLVQAARDNQASVVVLTLSGAANEEILEALRSRDSQVPFTLFVVPALQEMLHSPGAERVGHVAVVRLRDPLLHALPPRLKRAFDVTVSAACLAVLAPLMALIAAAVRLEMGPGVLFKQTRVGLGGNPFVLFKFRSLKLSGTESDERWSAQNEVRIGPVGRFIRKTSMDELPQLINILRGDMSLVGPRPERPHFVEQFGRTYAWYSFRHRVRPGLTGWAAVHGLRGDTSIQDRCLYDNAYIDNWSLWLDMKILVRTVTAVLKGAGS